MPPKIPGVERAVERRNLQTSVMACVCCAAIPRFALSRGNGFHGVNLYQRRACHQNDSPKYRRQADGCFTERSLQEYRTGKRVRTCEFNNSTFSNSCFERDGVEGLRRLRGAGRRRREKCGEP